MNTLPPLWNFQTKHWQKVRGYPRRSTTNDQKAESKEHFFWHLRLDLEVSVEVWRFCRVRVFFPCVSSVFWPLISMCRRRMSSLQAHLASSRSFRQGTLSIQPGWVTQLGFEKVSLQETTGAMPVLGMCQCVSGICPWEKSVALEIE